MLKFCKRYSGLLFVALTVVVIYIIAQREEGIVSAWSALLSMRPLWAAAAVALWAGFLSVRAYTMQFYLARQGIRVPFFTTLKASVIGLFYSGITPAASGGQPMQMFYLHKSGVPVSVSASGVMIKFVGFQSMLLLFAAVSLGCNYSFVSSTVGGSMWLVALGFGINAVVVLAVFCLMINRRAVFSVMGFSVRLGERLHLIRDRNATEEKVRAQIEGYLTGLNSLRDRPFDMLYLFTLSGLQVLTYSGIIWALYHAFGLSGAGLWQLVTLQLLLYQTVSFVPLPGATGAQEGMFYLFLQKLLPASACLGMLFAWRFFTFYATMLAGAGIVLADSLRNLRKQPRG